MAMKRRRSSMIDAEREEMMKIMERVRMRGIKQEQAGRDKRLEERMPCMHRIISQRKITKRVNQRSMNKLSREMRRME